MPFHHLHCQDYQPSDIRGLKVIATLCRCCYKVLNNITTAHGFAVTSQIQQSCVKIHAVVLVELQGKGLILKGSAGVHFKDLARASILLLSPPSPMTTQSTIDLAQ